MEEGWTEIVADLEGDSTLVARNKNGGAVQMGTIGDKPGVGPMQLLLAALSGCTGGDIVSILTKKRIQLSDFQVRVRGKRATEYPMVWTDIHVIYLLWGEGIRPKDVEQAIQLSEEKYCSVGIMLGKTAKITSEYQILKPGDKFE